MRLQEGGYLPLQDDRAIVVFRQGSAAGLANRKQLGLLFWVQGRAKMPYEILIPDETRDRLVAYEASVRSGAQVPGKRLDAALVGEDDFLTALLRTKLPQIFAKSAVAGDGSSPTRIGVSWCGSRVAFP